MPTPARTAAAFAAGGLIPFATWLVLLPALGAWDLYRGGTILRPVVLVLLACVAGGAVAGGTLGGTAPGGSGRWRLAFGTAFGATLWMPFLVLGTLPALSGGEKILELVVGFTPALAVSHALLGGIALALGGSGWMPVWKGTAAGGVAGAAGGVLLALIVRLSAGSGGAAEFAVSVLGAGVACLLPLAFAGWWLGRRGPGSRPRPVRGRTRSER